VISTLPDWYQGSNFTSEVMVSGDGCFVYGANRYFNTIATFSIDQATGEPTLVGNEWTRADYPRMFNIDPSNKFMHVVHNKSDNVSTFRIGAGGSPEFAGQVLGVGSPSGIAYLAI